MKRARNQLGSALRAAATATLAIGSVMVLAQEECPADAFKCAPVANSSSLGATMVLPSWCSSENPFLMPRPPSQLANSSTDLNSYIQQYACDDPTDPFAECSLIESFFACEVFQSWDCDAPTVSGNCTRTTFKGVTASVRDTSDFDTTSHISIFDSRFNLLSTPVRNYSGSLSFVELQPATYNGGLTTWAVYGGPSGANYSAPIPPDGYFPACGAGGAWCS